MAINRAKSKLRITSKREGESGKRGIARVKWELPDNHLEYQNTAQRIDTLDNPSLNNDPLPKRDDTLDTPNVLGMPVEKAIEVWRKEGAPVIHLGAYYICWDGKTEPVWLNNKRITIADFQAFLLGSLAIPPMILNSRAS